MKPQYISFTAEDVDGLAKLGIDSIIVEIDEGGNVLREIGLDRRGQSVHKYPGSGKFGERGLFDIFSKFERDSANSEISEGEFNKLFRALS